MVNCAIGLIKYSIVYVFVLYIYNYMNLINYSKSASQAIMNYLRSP
jgi:hypothetical protein